MYILMGMVLSFIGMMGVLFFSRLKTKNELIFEKTSAPEALSKMSTHYRLAISSGVLVFAGLVMVVFNVLIWA